MVNTVDADAMVKTVDAGLCGAGFGIVGSNTCSCFAEVSGCGHICVLRFDGTVWCFGNNVDGQLGNDGATQSGTPTQVELPLPAVQQSAGENHNCAVLSDSTVWCWGRNINAQLGRGTTSASEPPASMPDFSGVKAVSCGEYHCCSVKNEGSVWCWGKATAGRLGDGSSFGERAPVQVVGLPRRALATSVSDDVSCALLEDGGVWCWGENSFGQVGDGSTITRLTPVELAIRDVVEIRGSYHQHICARTRLGEVLCWGTNEFGQLGNGSRTPNIVPMPVMGMTEIVDLDLGAYSTLAVKADGSVLCSGRCDCTGVVADVLVACQVAASSDVVAVAAACESNCGIQSDGSLFCWGDNSNGQLGIGTIGGRSDYAVPRLSCP